MFIWIWIYLTMLMANVAYAGKEEDSLKSNLEEIQICGYFKPLRDSEKFDKKMVSSFDAKGFYKRQGDQRLRIYHISVNIDRAGCVKQKLTISNSNK